LPPRGPRRSIAGTPTWSAGSTCQSSTPARRPPRTWCRAGATAGTSTSSSTRTRAGAPGTAFAVRHPTAGLPLLSLRALGDRRKDSSEQGRLLLTDQVITRLDEVKAGTFFAAGDWIIGKNDNVLAPTTDNALSRLDSLARAAEILAQARRRAGG
jgi:hypothetical protein